VARTPQTPPLAPATSRFAAQRAAEQDVYLREVDEAVRQDEMAGWARRYGLLVLLGIAIVLLTLGGYLWWRHHQAQALGSRGETMAQALDQVQAGRFDEGDKALQPLASDPGSGIGAAALAMRAAIADQKGQGAEAAKLFGTLSATGNAPQPLRNLATLRRVAAQYETLPPQQVIDRLKPLAVPGNPWFGNAGELVGMAYLKQGRRDLAGPMFAGIAKDEKAPETIRRRARQMAGLLGVDAIGDPSKAVADSGGQ
jgi:hypothetical protein